MIERTGAAQHSGVLALAAFAALLLAVAPADAGAGRSRPSKQSAPTVKSGGSRTVQGGGGAAPRRAVGRASYGYSHGGNLHHGSHHLRFGYYPPYYSSWPYLGWYGGWYGYRPYYRYPAVYPFADRGATAAVEIDVKPKRADVRIDGEYVGQARDYNGTWDLLWLEPGGYRLEFSRPGYMTLQIFLRVRSGATFRIVERMQKGEGLDPRSTSAPPDERPAAVAASGNEPPAMTVGPGPGTAEPGLRSGLLRIDAEPGDAVIYLDGEYLARADELRRIHGALPVAVGAHTLDVVRPGFESQRLQVEVSGDQPAEVQVRLSPSP